MDYSGFEVKGGRNIPRKQMLSLQDLNGNAQHNQHQQLLYQQLLYWAIFVMKNNHLPVLLLPFTFAFM